MKHLRLLILGFCLFFLSLAVTVNAEPRVVLAELMTNTW